jgi:predicted nucleotidyltransferase
MACSAGLGPVTTDQQPAALLKTIVDALDRNHIPYMVVGSFASTFHGEPRTTQDLDLVIDPTIDSLQRLVSELDPSEFYVDADTARDALDRRTMFNVIEMATAWKVDLVIRRARSFSIEELARRQRVTMLGVEVATATAEDTIIAKLEWAKAGNSDRQLDDVAGILRVRGSDIDRPYIDGWVSALQLESQWERARAR